MAFKNIFGSAYAVVENIQYNGPRKTLTFDLVQYRSSSMEVESARSTYRLNGNLSTQEIDSVITDVPSGLDHEALPDDFDFDVFDTFKPYLIGNDPSTELKGNSVGTGCQYVCEHKPYKSEKTGWDLTFEQYYEDEPNPDYDPKLDMSKPENQGNTKTISVLKEKKIYRKIKYDWNSLHRRYDCVFIDKDGAYWEVTGQPGSHSVTKIDKPFLAADWDSWFSAKGMDAKDKNISSQIYNWLSERPEFKDAQKA